MSRGLLRTGLLVGLCLTLLVVAAGSSEPALHTVDRARLRRLVDSSDGELVVNSSCVQRSIQEVARSCNSVDPTHASDPSRLRVELSSLLHACVNTHDGAGEGGVNELVPVRRLRVVAGTARIYPELQRLSYAFSKVTGIPIYFNFSTRLGEAGRNMRAAIARPPPVVDTPDLSGGVDAWVAQPSFMNPMDQAGKLLDLTGMVSSDLQLKWFQIKGALREQMVVYGNKVVAIPITTAPVFLFYHRPTFERDGLAVPATWDATLVLAAQYNGKDLNGDGEPDYGFCMTPPNCFVDGTVLAWLLAAFVQTQGAGQGLFVDPRTLANLAASPALAATLELMRQLRLLGPTSGNCSVFEDQEFLQGRCLLSLTTPTTFKAAYSPDSPASYAAMRGRMGIAPQPGSTRVLDRGSMALVDCDAERCPMARVQARDAAGVLRPVNQPAGSSNVVLLINAQSPVKYQFYAYSLFSYLMSPEVMGMGNDSLLLDPRLETVPLRDIHLTDDAAAGWVAAGYEASDVAQFFNAYRTVLDNPNQSFEPKFAGAINITTMASIAAANYTSALPGPRMPLFVAAAMISRAVDAVIAEVGGPDKFGPLYRTTLNWAGDGTPTPPSAPPAARSEPPPSDSHTARTAAIAGAACGATVLAAAAVWGAWLWRRKHRRTRRSGQRAVTAPAAGPDTTLLVTDIQSSTALWEHVDALVMDAAMSLHHGVIRKAILAHGGYESATEGDSFIVAFPTATAALLSALMAQTVRRGEGL